MSEKIGVKALGDDKGASHSRKVVIFAGLPGAGKGTQSQRVALQLGAPLIAMGNLLRDEVAKGSMLGKHIAPIIASGNMPDISIIMALLEEHLRQAEERIAVLDGVPRDLAQAQAFEDILARTERSVGAVILLTAPWDFLIQRIMGRYLCAGCSAPYCTGIKETKVGGVCDLCQGTEFFRRLDDKEEIVRRRMDIHQSKTSELEAFYGARGTVRPVHAEPEHSAEIITEKIVKTLSDLLE